MALPEGLTGERFDDRATVRNEVDNLKRFMDKAAGDPPWISAGRRPFADLFSA